MGEAPKEYTVAQVTGKSDKPWGDNKDMLTTKVRFEGGDKEWKVFHNVAWPVQITQGVALEGWFNHDKGTFGLSKKHKGDAPTSSSTGGGGGAPPQGADPRGESIERQVAAKAAAEMASAVASSSPGQTGTSAVVAMANFEAFFDAALQKIQGAEVTAKPPVTDGGTGGEVPADTSDLTPAPAGVSDGVPF